MDDSGALSRYRMPTLRRVSGRWALCLLAGLLFGGPARAQEPGREAVQDAIALTEIRIEQADQLLSERSDELAATQLTLARDLQSRARASLAANQLVIALRQTRDARVRADRAIAIVRGLPDPERVSQQLERTRQVIERARELLQECSESRARALLRVAIDMQVRADGSFAESRYLAALQLTMSARERAEKALSLCRAGESLEEAARRALQGTEDLLPRARDLIATSGSDVASALLARAEATQSEARREMSDNRFAAAARLTQNARLQAQRAMRIASRAPVRPR